MDSGVWSATPEALDEQLGFASKEYDVVAPRDLPHVVERSNGRYLLLTSDDGYRDNFELALPILRAHRVAATFFVTTEFLDTPRLSWRDEIAWMVRRSRTARPPPDRTRSGR